MRQTGIGRDAHLLAIGLLCIAAQASWLGTALTSTLVDNGGFETASLGPDPLPTTFGVWGGDVAEIVTSEAGIVPPEGTHMLRFINTNPLGPHPVGWWSERRQLVDLSGYSGMISSGSAKAIVSFQVNRILGDDETDTQFGVLIRAYEGSPATFPDQNNNSELGSVTITVDSDSDVSTWEYVTGQLSLPTNTDFLMINIFAAENIMNDAVDPELDGHYADDVTLDVVAPIAAEVSSWGRMKMLYQ